MAPRRTVFDSGFLNHGCLKMTTNRLLYEMYVLEKWLIAVILIFNICRYVDGSENCNFNDFKTIVHLVGF
jgi:hypothetical protein